MKEKIDENQIEFSSFFAKDGVGFDSMEAVEEYEVILDNPENLNILFARSGMRCKDESV